MQNQPLREDEFDIEVFSTKLYRVGKKAGYKLLYPIRVLFGNPLRLLVFLLSGAALALVLKLSITPVYTSSFILRPNNTGDLTFANILYDLESMTENEDKDAVALILGLTPETASSIRKIESNIIWRSRLKDSAKLIEVIMHVTDPNVYKQVQDALIYYIENNEHYALFRSLREKDIEGMKSKVNADLTEIDSLKRLLAATFLPRSSGGFVFGEAPDAVRVYESSLSLYRQKLSLNWQEAYVSNFELMKAAVPSSRPSYPETWKLLLLCLGIAVLACLFWNIFGARIINSFTV